MKRRTAVKRNYHTIDNQGKVGERKLAEFLVRNGQALLPMMELIEHSRMVIDELIDVMGRASTSKPCSNYRPHKLPDHRSKAKLVRRIWGGMERKRAACV